MRSKILLLLLIVAAFTLTITGCKKAKEELDFATELSAHSDDQATVAGELDNVATDANTALEDLSFFNGRVSNTLGTICGATIVADSTSLSKKVTITYNGANCGNNHTRTGVVVLSLPAGVRWKDVGAVLTINIQNLKITRIRDNKSITINGIKTITNVNGGRLRDLATNGNITHQIASSGMSITFDNGSQRAWQIAKRRVFTYNNGIVITTTGTHTDGAITRISEWGTNRLGNDFVTSITEPLVIRQDCDFRLVSGQVTHGKLAATAVVTFGLNASGVPTSCPGAGTYYFKLVWTGANGTARTVILPY
jgi:hypothetical protein